MWSLTCMVRHNTNNTRPKVARMEENIDTGETVRSETTLEDNIALSLLFLKYAVVAVVHDVLQHLLDLRDTEFLIQLTGYCQFYSSQLSSCTYLGGVSHLP